MLTLSSIATNICASALFELNLYSAKMEIQNLATHKLTQDQPDSHVHRSMK